MTQKVAALVPMRHESKRVPGKNYRPFAGRPLYHHIIDTLLSCPLISEIMIDTDSPLIIEDAKKNFPTVRLIDRPEDLRADDVPMNDVLLHDVSMIDAQWYLQTHSTNPLLGAETISAALDALLSATDRYDSLFSVTALQTRLWDAETRPINHDPSRLLRTQDLPPVFEENSNIYIFTREVIEERHNRIGARPLMFEIERLESLDIDEELDFVIAESLFKQQRGGG